jgi:hypothetical protein
MNASIRIFCVGFLAWLGYYFLGIGRNLAKIADVSVITENVDLWQPPKAVLANRLGPGAVPIADDYKPASESIELSVDNFREAALVASENLMVVTRRGVHYVAKVNGLSYHSYWSPSPDRDGRDLWRIVKIDPRENLLVEYGPSAGQNVQRISGKITELAAAIIWLVSGLSAIPLIRGLFSLRKRTIAANPC